MNVMAVVKLGYSCHPKDINAYRTKVCTMNLKCIRLLVNYGPIIFHVEPVIVTFCPRMYVHTYVLMQYVLNCDLFDYLQADNDDSAASSSQSGQEEKHRLSRKEVIFTPKFITIVYHLTVACVSCNF